MPAKLKIDLNSGILEVEADDSFVKDIYDDFKESLKFVERGKKAISSVRRTPGSQTTKVVPDSVSRKPRKSKRSALTHKMVSEINFVDHGENPDLRTFFSQKSPGSNYEKNSVFIYYMAKFLKIEEISVDHVYTCYKYVGSKYPSALRQSLVDTAHDKGYIDTSTLQDVKLTPMGENFVEHDLPRSDEKSKK